MSADEFLLSYLLYNDCFPLFCHILSASYCVQPDSQAQHVANMF